MPAHNFIDIGGERFGRLRAIALAVERTPRGQAKWHCLCDCGQSAVVASMKLRSGHTKSCGCLKRRTGADHPNADTRPILDRLNEHSHTVIATRCKVWNGPRQEFGHGTIAMLGKRVLAHRAAWEAEKGPIPAGIDCLHDCPGGDNPACWNVDHLWLGTQGDNNADRDRKGRQIAPKGEDHGMVKLSSHHVLAIRNDGRLNREIADDYGISFSQVGRIKSRRAWSHLP